MDSDWIEITKRLKIGLKQIPLNLRPRYNAAPTSDLPVAHLDEAGERIVEIMRWGLVPFWAKDIKIGYSTFNAKAEGIESKPTFREAYKRRRCLVPVNNFYEWKTLGPKEKQPYAIALADGQIMVMAGLWETWKSSAGEMVKSFTIITTEPNAAMADLHSRMPVILDEADWPKWLGEEPANSDELHGLLKPYSGDLSIWPVDKRVGNVRNDDPGLCLPIAV